MQGVVGAGGAKPIRVKFSYPIDFIGLIKPLQQSFIMLNIERYCSLTDSSKDLSLSSLKRGHLAEDCLSAPLSSEQDSTKILNFVIRPFDVSLLWCLWCHLLEAFLPTKTPHPTAPKDTALCAVSISDSPSSPSSRFAGRWEPERERSARLGTVPLRRFEELSRHEIR